MTTLTPIERAVIRHLSLSEPMAIEDIEAARQIGDSTPLRDMLSGLRKQGIVELKIIRGPHGRLYGSGYILTPAGADLCEAMERERAELNAIAAQATREHGEPDGAGEKIIQGLNEALEHARSTARYKDGDALIAQATQSPRFFSPPVKPSLWARVKARLGLAA